MTTTRIRRTVGTALTVALVVTGAAACDSGGKTAAAPAATRDAAFLATGRAGFGPEGLRELVAPAGARTA
ncbi:hypothetical protein ABT263_32325 [Kitasatospora sp. NPDC001603]|uniref:hypothetical protein n=1 Tax=Kitasatospora sp. NPDC001603 TaxID=3154388 RepID=UPI00332124BD